MVIIQLFASVQVLFAQPGICNFETLCNGEWYSPAEWHWEVSDNHPINGNYSLVHALDTHVAHSDWTVFIHHPLEAAQEPVTWEFALRYDGSPSSANRWAVWVGQDLLTSGMTDYKALILGVNYTGSNDFIEVWERSGSNVRSLINTGIHFEESGLSGRPVRYRLVLDNQGEVKCYLDTAGTWIFTGAGSSSALEVVNTLRLEYHYTSSRDRQLAMDDIRITGQMSDAGPPPRLVSIQATDANELAIRFTRPVIFGSDASFTVGGIRCSLMTRGYQQEHLISRPSHIGPGDNYLLSLPSAFDAQGEKIPESTYSFYYPRPFDVVVSEIMADPIPSVMLPEAEYIEIMNRTGYPLPIGGWTIEVNGRSAVVPEQVLPADSMLILCHADQSREFSDLQAPATGIRLPPLPNSGGAVAIRDRTGMLIHGMAYDPGMFDTPEKKEGGWSLEMTDVQLACAGTGNWQESTAGKGGTPGEINSGHHVLPEYYETALWRASAVDPHTVKLVFSNAMDSLQVSHPEYYILTPVRSSVRQAVSSHILGHELTLTLHDALEDGVMYEVRTTADPVDCLGRTFHPDRCELMLPGPASAGAVVISEIMPDPLEGHREYLELWNVSEQAIDLTNWKIQVGQHKPVLISTEAFTLLPGAYALLTDGFTGIDHPGLFDLPAQVILFNSLPSLNNEGSCIGLTDSNGQLIDSLCYDRKWHHKLIGDAAGVALERISPDGWALGKEDWLSASADRNFQSPAMPNSQSAENASALSLDLGKGIISPGYGPYPSELDICYTLDEPGYMGRIIIFDLHGNEVGTIASGTVLGITGCFTFEGKDISGNNLREGIYLVYFEAYNSNGKRFSRKEGFVCSER